MKTAFFPGSFDPVTFGHLDVIQRAANLFDKLIVAVALNTSKEPMFSVEKRVKILKASCSSIKNIEIISFEGLLVNAINKYNVSAVIRGLRAISDFEYEFQMAMMNREINSKFETIFLMPSPQYSFVSSRMIKEIINLGGDVSAFVPKAVIEELKNY
ncbi:MAG TPA: pantetheine-phosphate adenylyltransferase [Victivallales bacterium]|nr:pantetheine-phosphate adenylyltransferase [Victivallales bacterium]HPO90476.1 pantetheine-phosphate adenylyltransferase [Victivallales bacterium]HRR06177.1 pantetheine-phosphate adenylyltransferase [Victivallales bacterium]HRR28516.1 pantetheine-phosphate adenylyltransferase [Victivallales bacterium]